MLQFLYHTKIGRTLLYPLTAPVVSKAAGAFLDTRCSKVLIRPFVKSGNICLKDYDLSGVTSFNTFFRRPLKVGKRRVEMDAHALIAPCDGLLSVYDITEDTVLPVKQSMYTVTDLLKSGKLAERFNGGYCLVFRLCVDHYHRYIYAASGRKSHNRYIPGRFHTVRPVALRSVPVFTENSREYTLIQTKHLGTLAQMEVGAMLVGRIHNHKLQAGRVSRGEEKGYFEYGGSTIILLVQPGKVCLNETLKETKNSGKEIPVFLGNSIGKSLKSLM